ncbi:hypothetical protein LIER_29546 [Lithospermum erythrorhizon]|uniref:Uncharacterized protein n=1 Tax=Lithospermum erythrorhizon TaxID=34254 RepID=A0AAV3RLE8_LITER
METMQKIGKRILVNAQTFFLIFEYVDVGIPINAIDSFWRTLDIEQQIKEETNINEEEEEKVLDETFENMSQYFKCGTVGVKRRLLSEFNEAISPEKVKFQDPPVRQTKG